MVMTRAETTGQRHQSGLRSGVLGGCQGSITRSELYDRPRRILQTELRSAGLWPSERLRVACLQHNTHEGIGLVCDLLRDQPVAASGPIEARRLALPPAIRDGAPRVLSLGRTIGAALGTIVGCDRHLERVAWLCAIFNHGVSIADYIADACPDQWRVLTAGFNELTLRRLCTASRCPELPFWSQGDSRSHPRTFCDHGQGLFHGPVSVTANGLTRDEHKGLLAAP